jgi:hypothetical protein
MAEPANNIDSASPMAEAVRFTDFRAVAQDFIPK